MPRAFHSKLHRADPRRAIRFFAERNIFGIMQADAAAK